MMLYTTYESSEDFSKLHLENLLFGPVTYLYNQPKPFEQFW